MPRKTRKSGKAKTKTAKASCGRAFLPTDVEVEFYEVELVLLENGTINARVVDVRTGQDALLQDVRTRLSGPFH